MPTKYETFLASKSYVAQEVGFDCDVPMPALYPFQRDLVRWALRLGRCAIFADTGLGKTRMQLEWARHVANHGRVLVLAPLAVAAQTVREGESIGVDVKLCRDGAEVDDGISITNYDRLHRFDPSQFVGIVLDESSCIKHHDAKTLALLIAAFGRTQYRLCATATPSPNDFTELGTHAEFLGICSRMEMLSEFFVHDASDTGTWRLKGHARKPFWRWVASWGALLRKPSDLGYADDGYDLPPLNVTHHKAPTDPDMLKRMGVLFAEQARDLTERRNARKASIGARVQMVADVVRESWTQNKSENTTEPIAQPIATNCSPGAGSGTRTTPKESVSARENTKPHSRKKKDAKTAGGIAEGMSKNDAPTCERDTSTSATILSHTTRSDDPSGQRLNEIGISEPNTESHLSSTTQCSPRSPEYAGYAEECHAVNDGSPSTMTMAPERSEDYCAIAATTDLEDSRTMFGDSREQWIIWCDLNAESELVNRLIHGSVNVTGSDTAERKEQAVLDFLEGRIRVLISKPSIFGYGLNLQCCARMAYVGVTDSYEAYYQSLRRIYRFGQKRPVIVHVFASEAEGSVIENLKRKEADAKKMSDELSVETMEALRTNVLKRTKRYVPYSEIKVEMPKWM